MMLIQYHSFIKKLHTLVDEEFELDTSEGQALYKAIGVALFIFYVNQRGPK